MQSQASPHSCTHSPKMKHSNLYWQGCNFISWEIHTSTAYQYTPLSSLKRAQSHASSHSHKHCMRVNDSLLSRGHGIIPSCTLPCQIHYFTTQRPKWLSDHLSDLCAEFWFLEFSFQHLYLQSWSPQKTTSSRLLHSVSSPRQTRNFPHNSSV